MADYVYQNQYTTDEGATVTAVGGFAYAGGSGVKGLIVLGNDGNIYEVQEDGTLSARENCGSDLESAKEFFHNKGSNAMHIYEATLFAPGNDASYWITNAEHEESSKEQVFMHDGYVYWVNPDTGNYEPHPDYEGMPFDAFSNEMAASGRFCNPPDENAQDEEDEEQDEEPSGGGSEESEGSGGESEEAEVPVDSSESYNFGDATLVKVDTDKLNTFGTFLSDKAGVLPSKIEAVGSASGAITNGWKDSNTPTFTSKFNSFVEAANTLPGEILAYGNYLTSLATEYEQIQQDALTAMNG